MSKYRLCYTEGDEVRFISHLDFMRTAQRIFRRANLPVKYSEGFNPHMVMTIGLPLSVGTSTECDCLEIELTQEVDTSLALKSINEACPSGISFLGMKDAQGLKPLHLIDSAVYEANFTTSKEIGLLEYISAPCVMIEKKSKRKINEVNIKDYVRNITIEETDGKSHKVKMHINAGNTSNLKPELVLKSMADFFSCSVSDINIVRKEIYFDDMTRVF